MCKFCKKDVRATKQLQLYKTPAVLVMSLNRFKANGNIAQGKLCDMVTFPVMGLDMTQFSVEQTGTDMYDLVGVVKHWGQLNRGHYKAVARNSINGKWFQYDDEEFAEIREEGIVDENAYVLFY